MRELGGLGTIVRVPDGREGTVVMNALTGVGIKWGRHNPDPSIFDGSHGGVVDSEPGVDDRIEKSGMVADAMLREPEMSELLGIDCVCRESEVEVIRYGLTEWVDEKGGAA